MTNTFQHVTNTCTCPGALCIRCKQPLCILRFSERAFTRRDLTGWCKSCVNEHSKQKYRRRHREGSFTEKEWTQLKQQYDFRCLRCGRKEPEITLAIDHIVPVSQNGTNTKDNIQPLCAACNMRKANSVIDYRSFRVE